MEKKFELLPPVMPNFAMFKKEAGLRQDGFKADAGFDIANFTEEEAIEYAELMKQTFLEHYKNRKSRKQSLTELTQ